MATNNEINLNKPVPAFQSDSFDDQTNVTGDGSVYQVLFPTPLFNNGNCFAPLTSIFTAPFTGLYVAYLTMGIDSAGTIPHLMRYYIVADGLVYELLRMDWRNIRRAAGTFEMNGLSVMLPMTAGSTAIVNIVGYNGTKNCSLTGEDNSGDRTPLLSIIRLTGL